jgi:hypothetical protein
MEQSSNSRLDILTTCGDVVYYKYPIIAAKWDNTRETSALWYAIKIGREGVKKVNDE